MLKRILKTVNNHVLTLWELKHMIGFKTAKHVPQGGDMLILI